MFPGASIFTNSNRLMAKIKKTTSEAFYIHEQVTKFTKIF